MIIISNRDDQNKIILEFLKKYGDMMPTSELTLSNCNWLSARISDLRKQGYVIESESVVQDGETYTRYIFRGHENDIQN